MTAPTKVTYSPWAAAAQAGRHDVQETVFAPVVTRTSVGQRRGGAGEDQQQDQQQKQQQKQMAGRRSDIL